MNDPSARFVSVYVLRGLVMIVMALDHVRDYHAPTPFAVDDLSRTTAGLFVTRWVTHSCASVFILLAGTRAFLFRARRWWSLPAWCSSRSPRTVRSGRGRSWATRSAPSGASIRSDAWWLSYL